MAEPENSRAGKPGPEACPTIGRYAIAFSFINPANKKVKTDLPSPAPLLKLVPWLSQNVISNGKK
ncbi:MAG: hypothetical protein B6D37_00880 [Sphingobacteriales bacterium UTBCD1]|nr:MAG: hypothetical protein B6D37_00880 [Sphingobacteriales bacterium UTBCD1]